MQENGIAPTPSAPPSPQKKEEQERNDKKEISFVYDDKGSIFEQLLSLDK